MVYENVSFLHQPLCRQLISYIYSNTHSKHIRTIMYNNFRDILVDAPVRLYYIIKSSDYYSNDFKSILPETDMKHVEPVISDVSIINEANNIVRRELDRIQPSILVREYILQMVQTMTLYYVQNFNDFIIHQAENIRKQPYAMTPITIPENILSHVKLFLDIRDSYVSDISPVTQLLTLVENFESSNDITSIRRTFTDDLNTCLHSLNEYRSDIKAYIYATQWLQSVLYVYKLPYLRKIESHTTDFSIRSLQYINTIMDILYADIEKVIDRGLSACYFMFIHNEIEAMNGVVDNETILPLIPSPGKLYSLPEFYEKFKQFPDWSDIDYTYEHSCLDIVDEIGRWDSSLSDTNTSDSDSTDTNIDEDYD